MSRMTADYPDVAPRDNPAPSARLIVTPSAAARDTHRDAVRDSARRAADETLYKACAKCEGHGTRSCRYNYCLKELRDGTAECRLCDGYERLACMIIGLNWEPSKRSGYGAWGKQPCHKCNGTGRVTCNTCRSSKRRAVTCPFCHGDEHKQGPCDCDGSKIQASR